MAATSALLGKPAEVREYGITLTKLDEEHVGESGDALGEVDLLRL